ncbi:hypothetical protein CIB95_06040 [Lottiidibacillus patelloidae]|uniref:Lipoprotein n=1 Tax=Lottiidibacillus patelloidae TaxID=2670334 RepID=A0A263BVZ5_9BACI|nr:hypothetical protein [Lottiidibacillus patelloidae]OZM57913.1 hypothetical protein CIB95_06040 [Lottiidibacillus patelloidae]
MNKKGLKIFAGVLLAGSLLVGCNSEKEQGNEENNNQEQNQEQNEFAIENTTTAKQVAAYVEIMTELGNAKEGNAVDWDKVKATYVDTLQSAVAEVSSDLDTAITAAIEGGKTEQIDANVARQIIDKTTQSYFYNKQKSLHKDVIAAMKAGNDLDAKNIFAELKHLVNEVMLPTAVKRDGYYGLTDEDSMEQNILAGLSAQEQALNTGNVDDYSVYKQITDKTLYRSYYLAALSYVEKIEAAVTSGEYDTVSLQNKQAEAWGFYQAIKGSLSGGDEEAALKIDEKLTLFVSNPENLKAEEVSELFTKAFVGKIKSYHAKAPKALEENDVTSARGSALEGNVFMQDIKLVMIEKLGAEKTEETFANANSWFEAISNGNVEEAATYSASIVEALDMLVK